MTGLVVALTFAIRNARMVRPAPAIGTGLAVALTFSIRDAPASPSVVTVSELVRAGLLLTARPAWAQSQYGPEGRQGTPQGRGAVTRAPSGDV